MTFRVPRPRPGYDLRSLPLKPADAFLLSRIDGVLTERDLALITGMSHGDVVAALRRLRDLGVVDLDGDIAGDPNPGSARPAREGAEAGRRGVSSDRPAPPGLDGAHLGRDALQPGDSPPLYDPAELDEEVELAFDRKRRILDLYYRLEDLTHYELLGVSDQADKKQIKSAYYQLAPEFHPDTYFRKQLGSYKQKIEAIFTRITLAHDTLTSKQRRAEYDQYVEQTHKNRAMAALIEQTPRDIATVASAVDASARAVVRNQSDAAPSPGRYSSDREPPDSGPGFAVGQAAPASPPRDVGASFRTPAVQPPQAVSAAPQATSAVPQATSAVPQATSAVPQATSAVPQAVSAAPQAAPAAQQRPAASSTASIPTVSMKERREIFARKLSAGLRRPVGSGASAGAQAPAAPPPGGYTPAPAAVRAAESLKARYDAARGEAIRSQVDRYSEMARLALDRRDFAAAANAYRIAASLAPDNAELQRASADVQRLAAVALADGYLKQARYEAEQGRWVEAALSYAKVCNGRPDDASAHERVAHATLQAGGNSRRAVEFARRAVELAPDSVEGRLTLALAYSAAGFEKSAAGELERAAELARNDVRMRELVAQAREQAKKYGKQT